MVLPKDQSFLLRHSRRGMSRLIALDIPLLWNSLVPVYRRAAPMPPELRIRDDHLHSTLAAARVSPHRGSPRAGQGTLALHSSSPPRSASSPLLHPPPVRPWVHQSHMQISSAFLKSLHLGQVGRVSDGPLFMGDTPPLLFLSLAQASTLMPCVNAPRLTHPHLHQCRLSLDPSLSNVATFLNGFPELADLSMSLIDVQPSHSGRPVIHLRPQAAAEVLLTRPH